jgi:hypothetical protein
MAYNLRFAAIKRNNKLIDSHQTGMFLKLILN